MQWLGVEFYGCCKMLQDDRLCLLFCLGCHGSRYPRENNFATVLNRLEGLEKTVILLVLPVLFIWRIVLDRS